MYSYLDSLKDCTYPSLKNITATIKKALKYAKPIRPGFQYSKALHADYFADSCKSGMGVSTEYLASERSAMPDTFVHRESFEVIGVPQHGLEVGITWSGL